MKKYLGTIFLIFGFLEIIVLSAISMVLCQDLVQVKMRNFSPF